MKASARSIARLLVPLALAPLTSVAADPLPFLPTGDARLRHLVELEADAGAVPLATTWPIPTFDLPSEKRGDLHSLEQPGTSTDAGWTLSGAVRPTLLRTFDNTPREKGEAGVQAGWSAGDYAGGALHISYAYRPQDGMHYRFDDSYVAWRLGNWWVSAGEQQRWWGPSWEGSLILSNNARPMPSVSLDRASDLPFETRWLHWLGPWHLTTFLARAEYQDPEWPRPMFWGLRVTARPLRDLEIGASRTAQWCRVGVCGAHAFEDVLLGKDNAGANVSASTQPGNQELSWDFRWHLGSWPGAIYYQENGETADARYPLLPRPRQTTDLVGMEFWSATQGRTSWRLFLEWVGTTCGEFSLSPSDQPNFNCAYNNTLVTWGYYYRGRVIGDSLQGDGRMATLGGLLLDQRGWTWELRLRRGEFNRGGVSVLNTFASTPTGIWNAEAKLDGKIGQLNWSVGAGVDRTDSSLNGSHAVGRAFLSLWAPWSR